jgi:hypothetical protein
MSRHMTERTTVRLPAELLARAKRKAAAEGRTLTSLIEDGLRAMLAPSAAPKKKRHIVIPVSKATGGLMPGFEDNPHRAAQEMEDLEYVERMNRGFK